MFSSFSKIAYLLKILIKIKRYNVTPLLKEMNISPIVYLIIRLIPIPKKQALKRQPLGKRLTMMLESISAFSIKFGQVLATRPDIVGDEIADHLANLHDNISYISFRKIKRIIEKDLNKPITSLYKSIEEIPIAAASIAQVHRAITIDGDNVVIKVIRPNVEEQFIHEFKIIRWVAKIIELISPAKTKRLRFQESINEIERTVYKELDLRLEGSACHEMSENFKNDAGIKFPKIYWLLASKNVLTQEYIKGERIDNLLAIKKFNLTPDSVLKNLAEIIFKMIYRDGFFHADLHPGNVLITESGDIALLDFGICCRLSKDTSLNLLKSFAGTLKHDYKASAQAHYDAGWVPKNTNIDDFAQALRSIALPILELPQDEISIAKLLTQMFKVTEQFNMETQPQLLQLQKTMLVTEGVGRKLNPNVNMWLLAEPIIMDFIKEKKSPKIIANEVKTQLYASLLESKSMLSNMNEIAESFNKKLSIKEKNQKKSSYFLVNLFLVVITVTLIKLLF